MSDSSKSAYLKTMISTANPAELRLMLFDGAIRFAERARGGLREKNYEQVHNGISRCQDIVMELINSMRPEHNPELCEKLTALYVFIYTRLMNASSQRDAVALEEAIELLRFERETWRMVLDKLAGENHRAGGLTTDAQPLPRQVPSPAADASPAKSANPSNTLIGARVSING